MPIGINKYMGLGLPPIGNAILQGDSTDDILTLEHSTADEGLFLVLRDEGSSLAVDNTTNASDVFRFTSGGGVVTLSTQIHTWTGFKKTIVDTSVSRTVSIADSGTLFVVSSVAVSSMKLTLPTGDGVPGMWFELFISSGSIDTSRVRVLASSDVAAKIHGYGEGSSAISTFAAVTPFTTAADNIAFARFTAMTSLLWVMHQIGGYTTDANTSLGRGQWTGATSD